MIPVAADLSDRELPHARPVVNGHGPVPIHDYSLPSDISAEEHLLGCAMYDSATWVPRMQDAQITGDSFYDRNHRLLLEAIYRLHAKGTPAETAYVHQELNTAKLLDEVGGMDFLTHVSGKLPDAVDASVFIERVRHLELLRQLQRSAISTIEDCKAFSGGIDDLLADAKKRFAELAESRSSTDIILARLEACRFDPNRRLPDMVPVMFLGKTPILTRGNIASLTAVAKAGKSSTTTAILASTFWDKDHGKDCFTFNGLNLEAHAVIHFDTEQHGKDHEFMQYLVLKRAGVSTPPPWFHSYSRKGATTNQLRDELEVILKTKAKIHKGISLVILDGVADFVNDVNDPKECNPLVAWLESLSVKYNCAILCILHLNPVSTKDSVAKARGHLGSQLQRKGETDLRLKKSEDSITTIFTDPLGTRRKQVLEKDGPCFKWDADEGMHMSCKAAVAKKDATKALIAAESAASVFDHAKKTSLKFADFVRAMMDVNGINQSRAEARFYEMRTLGVLQRDILGFWVLRRPAP